MKSHFKEPNAIKKQDPKDHPVDGVKTPWDYRCPQYDQRTSCFVNAGTHYGEAHRQPVGGPSSHKNMTQGVIPFGRHATMKVDEVG